MTPSGNARSRRMRPFASPSHRSSSFAWPLRCVPWQYGPRWRQLRHRLIFIRTAYGRHAGRHPAPAADLRGGGADAQLLAGVAELHLTQPAVSMQVKQLEHCAGVPLFERMKRRLYLTQAGQEMARTADQVLRALKESEETFAALRGLRGGRLAIAVVSTAVLRAQAHRDVLGAASRGRDEAVRPEPRGGGPAARRERGGPRDHGAAPGRAGHERRRVRPPPARHRSGPDHPLAKRRKVPLPALAEETFLVRERARGPGPRWRSSSPAGRSPSASAPR